MACRLSRPGEVGRDEDARGRQEVRREGRQAEAEEPWTPSFREAERACFEHPHGEKILRYFRLANRAGVLRESREKLTEHLYKIEAPGDDAVDRFVIKMGLMLAADEAIGNGPETQQRSYEQDQKKIVIDFKTSHSAEADHERDV